MRADRIAAAAIIATIAFWAYARTLLPGVDLGDTGGFQAAVLWPFTSARRAYPLYFALAAPFVKAVSAGDPARGLNLFSALWAAIAVGLLTGLVAAIARSTIAGIVSGLLLAFSYTFWTQAVIAEVYSLHLALICACLWALYAYGERPTTARLAIVFAVYALSFGNHMAMILLLAPCTLFLFQSAKAPRDLLRPRILGLALACAVAGALQYTANFTSIWAAPDAPATWRDSFAAFWFDTTKSDWRESFVLGVGARDWSSRAAMWLWDARQQFGAAGIALAAAGAVRLWWISRPWAIFTVVAYACSTAFALTYNVGDPHVFFLPGHLFTALAAGVAVAPFRRRAVEGRVADRSPAHAATTGPQVAAPTAGRDRAPWLGRAASTAVAIAAVSYAAWRGWDTWPAADRHADVRGEQFVARTIAGIAEPQALLVSGMNWEPENALLYAARWERHDLAWTRIGDVLAHFPFLVRDNHDIGRDVVLTQDAAREVLAAYGGLFPIAPDDPVPVDTLPALVDRIPRGAPYVLTLLTPRSDERLDPADVDEALRRLAGGRAVARTPAAYEVTAGLAGEPPAFHRSADRPFRTRLAILGDPFTIRMDAWLPFDTFRRGGFGHVLAGHASLMTVERGASLVWIDSGGRAQVRYAGGLYAAKPRYRIPRPDAQLALFERDRTQNLLP